VGVGAIIQARLDSARLPGKVLRLLHGRPVLEYLVESLAHATTVDRVILATSDRLTDDPIAAFAADRGLVCFRGSCDDVAGRMLAAALDAELDAFVRANGDSPLLDPALVDRGISLYEPGVDLVSNRMPKTFPAGETVEVVSTDALAAAHREMTDALDHEHVTRFFYSHADRFDIRSFDSGRSYDDLHLAVDTEEQFDFVAGLIARMDRPHWDYSVDELAELASNGSAR
jgi:spore coat polysaccharide biosynthesis protein SpsF